MIELGIIAFGWMGANLVRRATKAGHSCFVYDVNLAAVDSLAEESSTGSTSITDLVQRWLTSRHLGHGARWRDHWQNDLAYLGLDII